MGILRTRMEQDLVVRGRSANTRDGYLRVVADLAKHYRRSPDQLTEREVQQYLIHLIEERKLAWSSCRVAVAALRFFYEITLGRTRATFTVPLAKGEQPGRVGAHQDAREEIADERRKSESLGAVSQEEGCGQAHADREDEIHRPAIPRF